MILWHQTLNDVQSEHPLYAMIAKGPVPALLGLGGAVWMVLYVQSVLSGVALGLALILLPVAITLLIDRARVRFEITETAALRHQGVIEQSLPFGTQVNYTLTRGPIRRALNLPGRLTLHSQTGIMRSWSLNWPIAATQMPALDAALTQALRGKHT